jgi:subtilisin family serine protease
MRWTLLGWLATAMATSAPAALPGTQTGATAGDVLVVFPARADLKRSAQLDGDARLVDAVGRLQADAKRAQADVRALLDARGVRYQAFWVANFIAIDDADAALVEQLASRADVKSIEQNSRLVAAKPERVAQRSAIKAIEPGVNRINAPALWAMGFRGQGVLVAGQDTGYQWDHPALKRQYAGWNGSSVDHNYHWFDAISSGGGVCGPSSSQPCDDNGHGTHTMGSIVGDDGGANQIGVAPGARWIACRNMNQGDGTPASYAACFQYFLAPTDSAGQNADPQRAPHVINNSWGCPSSEGCTAPNVLQTVVENVRNAGILVVVSAGNDGSACSTINTPAAIYAASFTVGSSNGTAMSSFSSRGPVTVDGSNRMKPDIVAPGSSIRSSTPTNNYASFSGTSMAGPHVAGVAALLMSIDPSLKRDPARVESILRQSAVNDITNAQTCGGVPASAVPNNTLGHGRVDALNAARVGLGVMAINGFE